MGDAHDFEISSDDVDDISLAEDTSTAEDGGFEISDDDVCMDLARELVMGVINAIGWERSRCNGGT